jgi:hypothetical protein
LQTYTHLLIGACVGALTHPGELIPTVACAFGATLPDVVQVPRYMLDKLAGRQPLAEVSPRIRALKNAAHSILVWFALLVGAWFLAWPSLVGLCLGGLTHPIIDALTHKDPKYWKNDAGFLWPLPVRLARYTGVWDYRIDHGVLRPKPPEAVVCALALAVLSWVSLRDLF